MEKIAIVIPTFNRKSLLKNTLSQLLEQAIKLKKYTFFFIVVVDGSTDGTIAMLSEKFSGVQIVLGTGNWWYTKSMNEGFRIALTFNPSLILALNDDIILHHNYLEQILLDYHSINEECVLGSISFTSEAPYKIIFAGVGKIFWWRFKQVPYLKRFSSIGNVETLKGIRPSSVLPGRGMLIPTSILVNLDLFDEKYVQYASDYDFTLNAVKNGYNVYVSWNAKLYCYEKLTGQGSPLLRQTLISYLKNYFNIYSPLYYNNTLLLLSKYGVKYLLPFTMLVSFLGQIKAYYKYK